MQKSKRSFSMVKGGTVGRTAEARQRYQEYLDRLPWGEHAQEAVERLGAE